MIEEADVAPLRPMFQGTADVTTALTVYLVLLLAIPSALRLPALGGVGYPAAMFAFALGLWWCWTAIRGQYANRPLNPVKIALVCYLLALLASYAYAMRRALPAVEGRQADIGLLRALALVSVGLICVDGISSWGRLLTMLRRTALGGGLFGLLGLLQFFTHQSLIGWISIPGFAAAQDSGVIERNGFTRASATAIHPLEYAAGLSTLFPIALTLALYDKNRHPLLRWGPAVVMAMALILSGSRSGYLGLVVGVVVLAFSWSRQIIAAVSVAAAVMLVVVFVTVPGMLGTIRGLFLATGHDSSTTSRSSSYALAGEFFSRSPILGRGFGTFLPTYRILDNGLLLLLVEAGLLGVLALLGLVATSVWWARRGPYLSGKPQLMAQCGPAISACIVAGLVLTFFFDALGFPISVGTLSLVIGLAGAWGRLARRLPRTGSAAVPLRRVRAGSEPSTTAVSKCVAAPRRGQDGDAPVTLSQQLPAEQ